MKREKLLVCTFVAWLNVFICFAVARAQTTAFTYQGRLTESVWRLGNLRFSVRAL